MIIEIVRPNKKISINSALIVRIQRKTVFMKSGFKIENLTDEETEDIINRLKQHNILDFTFDSTFD